jgi:hypothetical protein
MKIRRITTALIGACLALTGVVMAASPAQAVTTYHYAIGEQFGIVADGAAVNLTVENPAVNSTHDGSSAHSLAELAVFSNDRLNRIEVGWRKKATDTTPKMFVYHAVNGVNMGYNLCTDYSGNAFNAGSAMPPAWIGDKVNPARFQILHSGTAWWIAMSRTVSGVTEGGWVCYFPDSTWTSAGVTWNKVEQVQAYAEVASPLTATPCSDMGDGQDASSGTSARIGSYTLQGQTSGPAAAFTTRTAPTGVGITISVQAPDTFRYGWKGYKDNPSPTADSLPGIVGC